MKQIIKSAVFLLTLSIFLNSSAYGMSFSIFGNIFRSDNYADNFFKEYTKTFPKQKKQANQQIEIYKEAYFLWLDKYLYPIENPRKEKFSKDSREALKEYILKNKEENKDISPEDAMQYVMKKVFNSIDAHTLYLPKKDAESFTNKLSGKYKGIGILFNFDAKDKSILVIKVFNNSPAQKSGIVKGDKIIGIEGEIIKDEETLDTLIDKIRGENGTNVKLIIKRKDKVFDSIVKRGDYYIPSVESEIYENKYAYISINSFNTDTASLFRVAINSLKPDDLDGLIIDVRNNPGGLLEAVVLIADTILSGETIVSIKGRTKDTSQTFLSINKTQVKDSLPIVVLVNSMSASAAELLAGSLALNNKAVLVGENSFGKWSVQSGFTLKDKSIFNITTQLFYAPKNATFQGIGIAPDIEVRNDYYDKMFREKNYPNYLETKDIENVTRAPKIIVNEKQCGTKIYDNDAKTPDYVLNCGILYLKTLNFKTFEESLAKQ
jgi:carboxyl-terminal processing protease